MSKFLQHQWKLVLSLAVSGLWWIIFPTWVDWVTTYPLDIPISLVSAVQVEADVLVRAPENHNLEFRFDRTIAFDELSTSIGAMGLCKAVSQCSKGVPVLLRWSLTNQDSSKTYAGGDVETKDSHGWSQAHVYRFISAVRVPAGNYKFKAQVLRPAPELAKLPARIILRVPPKSASTWQFGLVWWGTLAQFIIFLPVAAYAALVLLWRGLVSCGIVVPSSR